MLRFTATECGSKVEDGSIICGASNSKDRATEWHSLIFVRGVNGDDDGPYFELDDQSQGFHNGVSAVSFRGSTVSIELAPPLGRSFGHRTIIVELHCPSSQVKRFKKGLRTVFRDMPERVRDA